MGQRFEGKIAVVMGGNSGIGLASAKAFALEGARVIITGRDPDTLRSAAQQIGHGAVVCAPWAARSPPSWLAGGSG